MHHFHLPPSGGVGLSSPVGSYSPSGRASAPARKISTEKAHLLRQRRTSARPLSIQRLAAELVATSHGLDRAHVGAICDALTAAGIDPAVWTARAITDALNADMRARGWSWPDHIANPGGFLSSRLRRLSWTPPVAPPQSGGCAAASMDKTPHPVVLTEASRARIAAAREEIRRVLTERTRGSHAERTRTLSAGRGSLASRDRGRAELGPSDVDGELVGGAFAGD